jgi:16S rRNA (adenine1518-N6/adenine1519-N6)-dimethyltransferase
MSGQPDDLPPLREVIARHSLAAKRSLGQNFLLDLNLTGRIARAAGPLDGVTVIEIGPGPGGLTRALLAEGARKVIAIERDDRAIAALGEIAQRYPGRLDVIAGDALTAELKSYVSDGPARIVANLPYNVATPLLVSWLATEPWPPWFDRLVLMFQREVAERIAAPPGGKQYGRLSVLAGWRTRTKILFDIHPSNFVPPPKVTSSVVELVPRPDAAICDRRLLERVTAAAFGQRRKMLRQSLKSLGVDPLPLLTAVGIEPTARAEEIPVEGFVALTRAFHDASIKA